MKKPELEEILKCKLPIHINSNFRLPDDFEKLTVKPIEKEKFLTQFRYGDEFSIFDYPEIEKELEGINKYCLIDKNEKPTLSLTEAYKETPILGIPYIELDFSKDSSVPVAMFITWNDGTGPIIYVPRRGNTIRLDTNTTIDDSGLFDFDWENKKVLENSDLLFIVKKINRQALCKYLLRDIYDAFQKYRDLGGENIITIDRELCIQEFEEVLGLKIKER